MDHALVKLARTIDWRFLEERFGAVYADGPGRPPLPTRLMAGLAILKHTYNLSDEVLCERWVENPYYQFFCGEEFFQHRLPFDRSSLTRWRQRMGEERLQALLQESLAVAAKTGAMKPAGPRARDRRHHGAAEERHVPDRRQAAATGPARSWCGWPRSCGVELRQSYARVGKFALIKHQRYAHAKQFKRANRALRKLKTYLGRVIRDIGRKIDGDDAARGSFASAALPWRAACASRSAPARRARSIRLHAPEVECIGKGKAHKPYEFGVKVSVATTLNAPQGGQFVAHVAGAAGQSL